MGLYSRVEGSRQQSKSCVDYNNIRHDKNIRFELISVISDIVKSNPEERAQLFRKFCQSSKLMVTDSENSYLTNPFKGMQLLSRLTVSGKMSPECAKTYELFCGFVEKYMIFANNEDLPNEAEMHENIHQLQIQLKTMMQFPVLKNKHVIALGGGFSAGKSSFINSILELKSDILPTDTMPTTSIPTYVVSNKARKKHEISAFNLFGKEISIDHEAILAISHEFARVYGLTLGTIINNIVVKIHNKFEHIAFLDTPGYSKTETGVKQSRHTDAEIALAQLCVADRLIWFIDIENGTLLKSDIDFIKKINVSEPILFIINKADKKPISEVRKVVGQVKLKIKDVGLPLFAVIAYSSHKNKVLLGQVKFKQFFENCKHKKKNTFSINNALMNIIDAYKKYHSNELVKVKSLMKKLNMLDVLLLAERSDQNFDDVKNMIKDKLVYRKKIQASLRDLEVLASKVGRQIDDFMEKI